MSIAVRKKILTAALATGISAAVAVPAMAVTVGVGGGLWDYGTGSGVTWSNYHHNTVPHRSSVRGAQFVSSVCVPPGWTSFASTRASLWGNKAFWNYC